jgi:nitric oxide reductase subunit B
MGSNIAGAWRWKWALALSCAGVIGMTVALLIAGYEQSFVERALNGSTWEGYFQAQRAKWFMQGMFWRQIWGWVTAAGVALLAWDLLVIGRKETRAAEHYSDDEDLAGEAS